MQHVGFLALFSLSRRISDLIAGQFCLEQRAQHKFVLILNSSGLIDWLGYWVSRALLAIIGMSNLAGWYSTAWIVPWSVRGLVPGARGKLITLDSDIL